ncbi:MAG: SOS response-associated peptidase [Firmicutes bacterium]|nr:SOS response-associated peptidase [Bacillota bacterium]
MCGRFSVTHEDWDILTDIYGLGDARFVAPAPRYNIAPTQEVPALYWDMEADRPQIAPMRWGLLPDSAYATINARSESLLQRPTYRSLVENMRCLIIADGYYEWAKGTSPKEKQPYYVRLRDHRLFAMAGLHSIRRHPKTEQPMHTFTIITTAGNEAMQQIPHDRMPAILKRSQLQTWLMPQTKPSDALSLLQPYPADQLEIYRVSTLVNRWQNDTADCIRAIT